MTSIPAVKLSAADLCDVIALEQAAFSIQDQQTPRSLRHLLTHANADVLGLKISGKLQAAAIILYRRGSRIARLYSIATQVSGRKSGLASDLLYQAERAASGKHCVEMRAEVREKNRASRRLFERSGYRAMGRRAGYYTGGMDAICYAKQLEAKSHG